MTGFLLLWVLGWTFPHDVHHENGVDCETCHEQATTSLQSADLLLPDTLLCTDCHENAMGYPGPQARVPLWISHFPHKTHAEAGCARCHGSPANPTLPAMETCLGCHNDARASATCYTCHSPSEERLKTYHPPRWLSLHGTFARNDQEECLTCHRENQAIGVPSPAQACNQCHFRENLALQRHPENYLYEHPQAFFSRQEDCSSCHSGFEDCRSCHEEEHIYPLDHNQVNWLTWSGGLHGEEAQADPERCLSCHGPEEPLCGRCHGR